MKHKEREYHLWRILASIDHNTSANTMIEYELDDIVEQHEVEHIRHKFNVWHQDYQMFRIISQALEQEYGI